MRFLYPDIDQYPFDKVCRAIILALEARNFDVPGIKVGFYKHGSGETRYMSVDEITGHDFRLWFCRNVETNIDNTHYSNSSAVSTIAIPGLRFDVYSPQDDCGPTLYKYVGDDWKRDRDGFISGSMVNSRLYGERRAYLVYKGDRQSVGEHFWPERLVSDNDLYRQYDPEDGEPKFCETDAIFAQTADWLARNVLRPIKFSPLPTKWIRVGAPEMPIPVPGRIGPLFTLADVRDCIRIVTGHNNHELLEPSERYGLHPSPRFVWLDIHNDGTIPDAAYAGSVWCGIGQVSKSSQADELDIPNFYPSMDAKFVVRVKLNRANDVYVADVWPEVVLRRALFGKRASGYHLTNAEVAMGMRASGRTVVPLATYRGGYKLPVVLVNRELDLNEVEIVNGPCLTKLAAKKAEIIAA